MTENKVQPEPQLIEIPRIPSARPYKRRIAQHKRNKAAGGLITITTASLILNIAFAVVIYILQAGPV
ncbi:MAG TPA: hypothetical protein H9711_08015 [Candidatus Mediterraneibacter intestinavium]|nr:hypothetical protein [Candidatus Mediterraneibacter intestinavium]